MYLEMEMHCIVLCTSDLPSLLVYPVDYCFLTPSTGLLGGGTFILVLKKKNFGIQFVFLIFIYSLCGFTDNRLAWCL